MRLDATAVAGAWLVRPEPAVDERGLFARTVDGEVFAAHGLPAAFDQWSVSYNTRRATLRGMHYQREPHGETKVVRCTRGRVQDVAVDLRPESATYLRSIAVELSADNRIALVVPPGCAHGFVTLEPDTELLYGINGRYAPEAAAGVRWDDPAFAIPWAVQPEVMNDRDRSYPSHAP